MKNRNFFTESREQSVVKATIVSKYFWAWANVIMPTVKKHNPKNPQISYIDLFAGPGRYEDGTKSTPLLVLERAIEDPDMRDILVTMFNDVNSDNSRSLETAIANLPGVETLRHRPKVANEEVGANIVKMFEQMALVPTLFFVDPWGYKGLSLRLINSVLRNWGCDCIFFFNYNRINMGLNNLAVEEHMNALFGSNRAEALRNKLLPLNSHQRELTIVEELAEALQEMGGDYVHPFCFKNNMGTRTSHHLIFVSKHPRGYEIMKEIMAKESSRIEQGVPSFEYCPADERQPILFEVARPLDDLGEMLLKEFAGKRITMQQIYASHHVGRRYIKSNYKDILRKLEAQGRIKTNPPASERPTRKGEVTFADSTQVVFPPR